MGTQRTDEEIKQHHIESLGKELGSLYNELHNELEWLYMKWNEYVELFGTKPSRINLLNEAASGFFWIVNDTLWESIILHIARLTDPPQSAGKHNLTVQCLPVLIEDEKVSDHVKELIDIAGEKSDFCRDWRNRHLAHRDLKLAIGEGAEHTGPLNERDT